MQYNITINQVKALAWGLNPPQALLFSFVYGCPSWAQAVEIDGQVYFFLAKGKICEELPLLTDKPDTAYRLLKQLKDKGLLLLTSQGRRTLVALTELGKTWNRQDLRQAQRKNIPTPENNPGQVGNISDPSTENYPTDQSTSYPTTTSAESRRGSRLPDDWQAPEIFYSEAARIHPGITRQLIASTLENFHDYWKACPGQKGVKRDWLATWRMWLKRERFPDMAGGIPGNQRTRDVPLRQQLTDTSWAD